MNLLTAAKGLTPMGWVQLLWKPVLVLALVWYGLHSLHERDEANYERGRTDYAAEIEAAAKPIIAEQGRITVRTETVFVDRIKTVRGKTITIIKEVPVYVPADSPDLPPGFRVLHDAAAQGAIPDPGDLADAAPVPAQDAASTIAENYGICHETEVQLTLLQDWVRQQSEVAK